MANQRHRGHGEGGAGSVLVVMPTYDERDNLAPMVRRLHQAMPTVNILVVDDASPDGTGDEADKLAAADERVHVLHRTAKTGLGAAYAAGFEWALHRDYDVIVEMDADGSHAPEDLPGMVKILGSDDDSGGGADVVLGSRYVPGGQVVNWPWHRALLSRGGNLYSKLALGVPINDITGGFRVYRRAVLEKVNPHTVASQGYCFQVDIAYRSVAAGFVVVEVPITFVEREVGDSKMNGSIVREALLRVTKWGLRRRGTQVANWLLPVKK